MYVQRQLNAVLGDGELIDLGQVVHPLWRFKDALPKYVLSVANGKWAQDFASLTGSAFALPLPPAYSSARPLTAALHVEGIVKVVVVTPDMGTCTYLVKGTAGTTDGDHPGLLVFSQRVTSITITAKASTSAVVDWFLHELPDLSLAASYRLGQLALGVSG